MSTLLTLMFVALLQLAMVLHVRNTLIDCATQGARYGALADRSPEEGAQRARELITGDLSDGYARDVTAATVGSGPGAMVVVRIRAPLPVLGLLGPGGVLTVTGHARAEVR